MNTLTASDEKDPEDSRDQDLKDHPLYQRMQDEVQQSPFSMNMTSDLNIKDLRPCVTFPLYDQGSIGSCIANAIAAALKYGRHQLRIAQGQVTEVDDWDPCRYYIYNRERQIEEWIDKDNGANIRDGFNMILQHDVCPEARWPYL